MRSSILFLLLFSLNSLNAQTIVNDSFQHNGIMRYYSYYVPAVYDGSRAFPLVFNLHGYGSASWQQSLYGDFKPIADTSGFIIVHPDGTIVPGTTSTQYWNVGFFASTVDDVDFLEQLIDSISSRYYVNPNRVYSTGMSNGGFMSYEMACQSSRITAIASVTGSMTLPSLGNCNPSKPIPVMQIHGTADPTVPYNGNANFMHQDSLINFWVNHNNCQTSATFDSIPDIIISDNARAEHYVWEGGDSNAIVEFYKIINGGHTWPGAAVNIGVTCMDFSASREIWRFFSQYGEELPLSINQEADFQTTFSIWPNPVSSNLSFRFENEIEGIVNVYSLEGKRQLSSQFYGSDIELDLNSLKPGLYILEFVNEKGRISSKFVKK